MVFSKAKKAAGEAKETGGAPVLEAAE
jgi:hypothetical protein